jgi:predicted HTH domain antitoxin
LGKEKRRDYTMRTFTVNIPDNVDIDDKEVAVILATQLYDKGKLSLGQAADLVGMSKAEFMDVLGKYGISYFGETMEDIESDLQNA